MHGVESRAFVISLANHEKQLQNHLSQLFLLRSDVVHCFVDEAAGFREWNDEREIFLFSVGNHDADGAASNGGRHGLNERRLMFVRVEIAQRKHRQQQQLLLLVDPRQHLIRQLVAGQTRAEHQVDRPRLVKLLVRKLVGGNTTQHVPIIRIILCLHVRESNSVCARTQETHCLLEERRL